MNQYLIMKVIGIDLAGKEENDTGLCVLIDKNIEVMLLHSDMEILKKIEEVKPDVIAIDAPFWIPKFKDRLTPWRHSEELLIKRGFNPISPTLPMMQLLANRAAHLVSVLKERKYNVIEVFARASEEIYGLSKEPRKNKDEYDALICAFTGKSYLENNYENLDGVILPKQL